MCASTPNANKGTSSFFFCFRFAAPHDSQNVTGPLSKLLCSPQVLDTGNFRLFFAEVKTGLAAQHKWIPVQNLPFPEVVLYAYAADRTPFPTYVCLPSGLYKARTGQVVAQTGPDQEILPLSGIYFFDGWRVHPTLPIPGHLPRTKEAPVQDIAPTAPAPGTEPTRSPEEEARDILATAAKNQAEDGPKYKEGSSPRMPST